jgi:hypothetical protein
MYPDLTTAHYKELDQSKTELETRRDEFLRKRKAELDQELSQLDETDAQYELTAKV